MRKTAATIFILAIAWIKTEAQNVSNFIYTQPAAAEVYGEHDKKLGVTPFDLNSLSTDVRKISIKKDKIIYFKINKNRNLNSEFII